MFHESILDHARSVIEIESEAISALAGRLDRQFEQACQLVCDCTGRIVVIGMGKSGHIGGKIASTLASTGSPAFFVHPGEASHGDIGMVMPKDLVLMISNSGETAEIIAIIPIVKRLGVKIIALTGVMHSTLAHLADVSLDVGVDKEACLHNLAPTASTTATLVMGDALAVVVQRLRGFSAQDFARTHPGGILGKRLLLYASDIMHRGEEVPLVDKTATLHLLLLEMTSKSLGMVGVVDEEGKLQGMFTDGDLRRTLHSKVNIYESPAIEFMNRHPLTIREDTLAEEIVQKMRDYSRHGPHALNCMFIVDQCDKVVGALNTHDLLRAGII